MLLFIKRLFAWWDGATLGTLLAVARRARKVGSDEFGNRYYEERRPSFDGKPRRWVIYNGYADASRVPVAWHGWLHHTFAEPPTQDPAPVLPWEKQHQPNLTGTIYAWRPQGSLARSGKRAPSAGDHQAWSPASHKPEQAL